MSQAVDAVQTAGAKPRKGRVRPPDVLERFCDEFLKKSPVIGAVPFAHAVWQIENFTSILLYRQGQFQVQMFATPGPTVVPEHTHPNVDSIEVYVGGNIHLSHSGKYLYPKADLFERDGPMGLCSRRGLRIRVRPNDVHGGVVGEGGGVFLSVQHWLNGVKPHCVAADYSGITMGEDHMSQVVFGDATTKPVLTAKDAASLET